MKRKAILLVAVILMAGYGVLQRRTNKDEQGSGTRLNSTFTIGG